MPKKTFKPEALEAALQEVRSGLSKKAASKKYGVSRSTIQFRLSEKFKKDKCGPCTILTQEEEDILEKWIANCSRKGFPRRKEDIQLSVQEFLLENKRDNPFKNNLPGKGWYRAFLNRHPNISIRESESVTAASACLSENDIRGWFKNIETILKEEDAFHILEDPSRVFNGDETNFQLCPKGSKVLAIKGTKNVYEVDQGPAKSAVTVMFTFSGSGKMVPPMIIFPYKRIPADIVRSVPDSWGIGRSDSGWMKSEVFFEYIANVFNPFLINNKVTLPVILFVDGHKTHLTYQLSELCTELGIILIALYPNSTRILQPADVAAFKPIKSEWKKYLFEWRRDHGHEAITKENVAPILKNVVKEVKPEVLINGFRTCGLIPWDPDAIDFSKCLGKNKINEESGGTLETAHKSLHEEKRLEPTISLIQFEHIVGEEMLENFKNIEDVIINEKKPEEFFTLYRVWEEFSRQNTLEVGLQSSNTKTPQLTDVEAFEAQNNQSSSMCTEKNDIFSNVEVPVIGHNESYKTPTKETQTTNELTNSQVPSQALISGESTLSDVLMWPETPTRKGKRQTERVPFVITSRKWKILFEEKADAKKLVQEQKEERRRKREENKKSKEVKTSRVTERKRKRKETNHQNNSKKKFTTASIENPMEIEYDVRTNEPMCSKETDPSLCEESRITKSDGTCYGLEGLCYACGNNFKHSLFENKVQCDICETTFHRKCVEDINFDEPNPIYICKDCSKLCSNMDKQI